MITNETLQKTNNLDATVLEDGDFNQKMFVVVRNTKSTSNNQDYQLNIGDVVKLGRIKLKIKFFTNG